MRYTSYIIWPTAICSLIQIVVPFRKSLSRITSVRFFATSWNRLILWWAALVWSRHFQSVKSNKSFFYDGNNKIGILKRANNRLTIIEYNETGSWIGVFPKFMYEKFRANTLLTCKKNTTQAKLKIISMSQQMRRLLFNPEIRWETSKRTYSPKLTLKNNSNHLISLQQVFLYQVKLVICRIVVYSAWTLAILLSVDY